MGCFNLDTGPENETDVSKRLKDEFRNKVVASLLFFFVKNNTVTVITDNSADGKKRDEYLNRNVSDNTRNENGQTNQ